MGSIPFLGIRRLAARPEKCQHSTPAQAFMQRLTAIYQTDCTKPKSLCQLTLSAISLEPSLSTPTVLFKNFFPQNSRK
jgi:hypothetical protein